MSAWRSFCRATLIAALMATVCSTTACNMIDAALGRHAHLSNMVPGQGLNGGDLQCWLTLEFDRIPEGIDSRDVVVRFTSVALEHPVEFDWDYIASRDLVVPDGNQAFGSGHRRNDETSPGQAPPVGALKVKFMLPAKERIENAPSTLFLRAELIWNGSSQDTVERTIEHVYASQPGGFF